MLQVHLHCQSDQYHQPATQATDQRKTSYSQSQTGFAQLQLSKKIKTNQQGQIAKKKKNSSTVRD